MRILTVCQYYRPEPFRISDICEELARRGHEVTVVTGEPNYPEGKIYKGYEDHQRSDEIINGVSVHRCPIIPRKTGAAYRFLNYLSYPRAANRYIKDLTASGGAEFDVVFVNQLSPVMMAEPAIKYKKLNGTPVLLYCLDLWPESLVAGGIRRGSFVYRLFRSISKHIYRSADRILIASRMFEEYLRNEFGTGDVLYLPQYAEDIFEPMPYSEPGDKLDLVFAGNIGKAQSLDTVIEAADKLPDVTFHIVGDGAELGRLRAAAGDNVRFYGRQPLEEMPVYYAKADAMIVTLQADPVLSITLPGKIQTYMAAGKPIIGAADGETKTVIEKAGCGFCGPAGNSDELVRNIGRFAECGDKRELGRRSRKYYEEYFSRSQFMDILERELAACADRI